MSRERVNPWILENMITNSTCDSAFIALLKMKIWIRKFQLLTETSLGSWNFELKMTTTKNKGVVGFLWLRIWPAKTKNYASSAYVSRRGRNSSDSKISGVKLPGTQNFGSCEPMSHQTSKNFHPTLAETEPVTSSKDAIQPIRKFQMKI